MGNTASAGAAPLAVSGSRLGRGDGLLPAVRPRQLAVEPLLQLLRLPAHPRRGRQDAADGDGEGSRPPAASCSPRSGPTAPRRAPTTCPAAATPPSGATPAASSRATATSPRATPPSARRAGSCSSRTRPRSTASTRSSVATCRSRCAPTTSSASGRRSSATRCSKAPPASPDGVERLGASPKGFAGRLALVTGRDTTGNAFLVPDVGMHMGRERGEVLFPEDG